MLFLIGAFSSAFIAALVNRRSGYIVVSIVGVVVAAMTFWRLMDVNPAIPAAMIMYACIAGSILGYWSTKTACSRTRFLRIVGGNVGVIVPCAGFLLITLPFRMWDEIQQEVRSPDHAYTATRCYKDGLTFGYQHVTLDAAGWHLFGGHVDVAEADCAGITGISWQGNRTLVIDYYNPTQNSDDKDALFVAQDRHWGDVQILYNNVAVPDTDPPAAPPKSQREPGNQP